MKLRAFFNFFRSHPKFFVFLSIFTVISYNEYLALSLRRHFFWNLKEVNSYKGNGDNVTKILIVADPQLIGYQNEHWILGPFTRFDADRYISRSYYHAYSAVQPDQVIFLGDLIDEMVFATDEEIQDTFKRFRSVFPVYDSKTTLIFIPGDNDIGGEAEPVQPVLRQKFEQHFPNLIVNNLGDQLLDISAIDSLATDKISRITENDDKKGLSILLSHVPLIKSFGVPLSKKVEPYRPQLVLSGHDHQATYFMQKWGEWQYNQLRADKGLSFALSDKNGTILEIQVPTVSYRMGVPNMAIGVLTVQKTTENYANFLIHYENLWLPKRYPQLYMYIVTLILLIIYLFKCIYGKFTKISKSRSSSRYKTSYL